MIRLKRFLTIFATAFSLSGIACVAVAGLDYLVFGKFITVFGLPRMYMYHAMYPVQYLVLASLSFSLVATGWASWRGGIVEGWKRRIEIIGVLLISLALAGCLCGMLYVCHDMKAGYVPTDWMWRLLKVAVAGPVVGGFMFLISVPYNVIETILLYRIADHGCKCSGWLCAVMQFAAFVGLLFATLQFAGCIQGVILCD